MSAAEFRHRRSIQQDIDSGYDSLRTDGKMKLT